jgi:serine protease Do
MDPRDDHSEQGPWHETGPAQEEGHGHETGGVAAPRSSLRLLLLLLLLATTLFAYRTLPGALPPVEPPRLVSHELPAALAPTGVLADVFDDARAATLQIEVRSVRNLRTFVQGLGTGFFISHDGLVLTAYHVVSAPSLDGTDRDLRLVGVGPDGRRFRLELVGFDAYLDLALLRADARPVAFLPLAPVAPRVGAEVVAIGNSRGEFLQPRAGRVSGVGIEAPRANFASGTIQLTAALAPGDSGGPVLNERGEAVGVVSYISYGHVLPGDANRFVPPFLRSFSDEVEATLSSFAVPVLDGSDTVLSLLSGGRRDVPVIGFRGEDYLPRRGVDLGPNPGALVRFVQPGGPGEIAGLRSYEESVRRDIDGRPLGIVAHADVVVAIDGRRTRTMDDVMAVVRGRNIGDVVRLTVQRGASQVELELELAAHRAVFGP